ncbi:MAG TPA: hypothetical protein VNT26_06955, partial [Candidatus Sulfotelmatobacter sp.]|nr:hypothetical protein [Candidatus Sulfotelmatobacter sp.]
DVLPPAQRLILFVAELLKDGFLAQSAFDENDMYCTPERQILLLRILLTFHRLGRELLQANVPLERVRALPCVPEVLRAKSTFANTQLAALTELEQRVKDQLGALAKAFTQPPR